MKNSLQIVKIRIIKDVRTVLDDEMMANYQLLYYFQQTHSTRSVFHLPEPIVLRRRLPK